jgi:hypothetical protein
MDRDAVVIAMQGRHRAVVHDLSVEPGRQPFGERSRALDEQTVLSTARGRQHGGQSALVANHCEEGLHREPVEIGRGGHRDEDFQDASRAAIRHPLEP